MTAHNLFSQAEGSLKGPDVLHYAKRYRDIRGIYLREDEGLSPDTILYEVSSLPAPGGLLFGLTTLYPIDVAGECNMTRGHFHQDRSRAEIYLGCQGEGLLMLMDAQGEVFTEDIRPHSIHRIPGSLAHRIINTGRSVLTVAAFWEEAAGHDYDAVEARPFPRRVFRADCP